MVISVIGEGGNSPSPEARRNVTVVCDDLDGVMKAGGGVTIGLGYARNTIVAKALESTTQTKTGAK